MNSRSQSIFENNYQIKVASIANLIMNTLVHLESFDQISGHLWNKNNLEIFYFDFRRETDISICDTIYFDTIFTFKLLPLRSQYTTLLKNPTKHKWKLLGIFKIDTNMWLTL